MRKMTALLLAALMLLGLTPVMAAEYDTLDQKLALQLQNGSGLTLLYLVFSGLLESTW